jgi:hypothetical protein
MSISVRTSDRLAQPRKRRKKKKAPSQETLLRVDWLNWLVAEYGASTVAEWEEPPVSFEDWLRIRSLAAHIAA